MRKKIIKALKKVLASYTDWVGLWVHYTDVNKLGVNPKQFHFDPAGIYLFPKEFKTEGSLWKEKKFKITVSIKPSIKILDLSTMTELTMKNIIDQLGITAPENIYKSVDTWWEYLQRHYGKKLAAKWNKDFRSLGYDAIFDDTGSIHASEIQLLVLNPTILKVEDVERQNVKRGQFSRLKQLQEKLKEFLDLYGGVDIVPVKYYKDWIGTDKRLKARLMLRMDADKYIEFEIEEDEKNHTMWVRTLDTNIKSFRDNWGNVKLSDNLDMKDEKRLKSFVELVMKRANQTETQIAASPKSITASNLSDKIKYYEQFLPEDEYDDSLESEKPVDIYNRLKKALMLEFIWHRVDELQRKKINYQYKRLDIVEILAYLYVVLYNFAYMEKAKGSDIIDAINRIKKSHDFLSEIHALTIALNSVHYYGKIIPDYVGILSTKELDELSNISEKEIADYARSIKIPF